jgi:hypothetical protein
MLVFEQVSSVSINADACHLTVHSLSLTPEVPLLLLFVMAFWRVEVIVQGGDL